MVIVFHLRLLEAMADKPGLPKAARGDKGDVVAVNDKVGQVLGLLYTVAEIVWRQVALGDEWIHNSHSVLILKGFKLYAKIIIILL